MFEDSLLESAKRKVEGNRAKATLLSIMLQILLVLALILFPLLYTEALPFRVAEAAIAMPTAITGPPPDSGPRPETLPQPTEPDDGHLVAPAEVPEKINMQPDPQPDATPGQYGTGLYIPGAITGVEDNNSIMHLLGRPTGTKPALPPPPVQAPRSIRVSVGVAQGMLIHRVDPLYTNIMKAIRLEGTVVLHAVISREGTIERLQPVSGHPLLVQSAVAAVQQWRYRPYRLNDQSIEVETQITVKFILRR